MGTLSTTWLEKQADCHSVPARKFCLRAECGPHNPVLGARFFKKGPMYWHLSNMRKKRNSWKVKKLYYWSALLIVCRSTASIHRAHFNDLRFDPNEFFFFE